MYFISNKGNVSGINESRESTEKYIEEAMKQGYDVKIDLWSIDDRLFLGNHIPKYETDKDWIYKWTRKLWIHCKNIDALYFCFECHAHSFWQEYDDYTITTEGMIWARPGIISPNQFCVMENPDMYLKIDDLKNIPKAGVCSNNIEYLLKGFKK